MNAGLIIAGMALGSWFSSVTGSGNIKDDTRQAQAVTSIEVSSGIEVDVTIGATPALVVTADDNIIPLVVTEYSGSKLVVHFKSSTNIRASHEVMVKVTTPTLQEVEANGGSTFKLPGGYKAASLSGLEVDASGGSRVDMKGLEIDHLKFDASGGSEIRLHGLKGGGAKFESSGGGRVDLEAISLNALEVDASGGGRVRAQGKTDSASYSASGGGTLHAGDLQANHVKLDMSGGGSAEVTAIQSVEGDVSGGGSVRVHGNPPARTISSSAGGSVTYQ